MSVIDWQIAVFIFVFVFGLTFGRKALYASSAIAGIWTLAMVYASWLIALQLGTIILAFICAHRLLSVFGDGYSEHGLLAILIRGSNGQMSTTRLEQVHGLEHLSHLFSALETAETRITIVSGFISTNAIDFRFTNALRRALERGVKVTLIFGGGSSQKIDRSREIQAAVAKLSAVERDVQSKGRNPNLKVIQCDVHEKILIKDQDLLVHGSFNWLSNAMVQSSESSTLSRDRQYIESVHDKLKRQHGF